MIQAIKLLREVEDISLVEAKEKIETMSRLLSLDTKRNPYTEAKAAQTVHSHPPARSGVNNVESDLPTEAFLFLQKGEVKEAVRVLKATENMSTSAANNLAKIFYTQHPEYQSDEIERLMRTATSSVSRPTSGSNAKTTTGKQPGKKKGMGFFEILFIVIILFNVLRAMLD